MPSPRKRNCDRKSNEAKRKQKVRKAAADESEKRAAFQYFPNEYNFEKLNRFSDIGELAYSCPFCAAKKWKDETSFCCHNGAVSLPPLEPLPPLLENLVYGADVRSNKFFQQIRSYNNMFAMTSIGCEEVRDGYMPTFKICGQLYHRIGSLLPDDNNTSKFLQIYFIGQSDEEAALRKSYSKKSDNIDLDLVKQIQTVLHSHNHYVRELKTAHEKVVNNNNVEDIRVVIKESKEKNVHKGRANVPSVNEIAILLKGEEYGNRDIIIEGR